jgi:hypothetical protein
MTQSSRSRLVVCAGTLEANREGEAMMTEQEWLTSPSVCALLQHQENLDLLRLTERKLRLLACALCRCSERVLSHKNQLRLETAEAYADGKATHGQLLAGRGVNPGHPTDTTRAILWEATYPSEGQPSWSGGVTIPADIHLRRLLTWDFFRHFQFACVREIFGNPFRPVAINSAWLTSDVLALARGIYDDRAFDRMPILADALQDAGCDNADILSHCRDTSLTHVRGCWVVDMLLGKE